MSHLSKLPRLTVGILQRVTAPQYDTNGADCAHLDWFAKQDVRQLSQLQSIAEAIRDACDERIAGVLQGGSEAKADARALLDEASGPLNDLIRDLIEKGCIQ